jgi:hypothetical protein
MDNEDSFNLEHCLKRGEEKNFNPMEKNNAGRLRIYTTSTDLDQETKNS